MTDIPVFKITINDTDESGIDFISLVENPAIMVKGFTFAEQPREFQFKTDEEKQIIAGPAIIPNMKIYRKDEEYGEYYVLFEEDVIVRMVEKFNQSYKQNPINVDHTDRIAPAFVYGSWIIDDETNDKSKMYGFDLPKGTWFVEVKVKDKDFWESEVKGKGKYGFSIEGLLGLKLNDIKINKNEKIESDNINDNRVDKEGGDSELHLQSNDTDLGIETELEFESYNDYPKAAKENACKVIRWKEEYGDEVNGMTQVGWIRANQLCGGENISEDTISRMASFARHRENSEISEEFKSTPWKDAGYVAWLGWGGDEGINWASRKLEQIRNQEFEIVEGDIRSSNVKSYEYDTEENILILEFNNGARYKYWDIDLGEYLLITNGTAVAKTSGSNRYGRWFSGKIPSVGAAVWQYLRNKGVRYQRLSEINKQLKTVKMKKRFKFAEYITVDGMKISIDGELAIGSEVYDVLEDGSMEIAIEKEYTLEDGTKIQTDSVGVIAEMEAPEVAVIVEEPKPEMLQVTPEEIMAVVNPIFDEMRAIIGELQGRIDKIEGDYLAPDNKVEEMNKEVSLSTKLSVIKKLIGEE